MVKNLPAMQAELRPRFNPLVGKIPWRRKWQPTPVFLPGQFHGQRSLVGYSPWGSKESDMTEKLTPFPSLLLFIFPIFLRKVLCEEVNCHEISPPPDKIVVLFRFTVVLQAMGILSYSTEVTLRPWIRTHGKCSQCYILIPARNIAKYCSCDDAD